MTTQKNDTIKQIRYAVVGLGHIAQAAVLPAFAHAKENSHLVALISGNRHKLKTLGRRYKVDALFSYDEFENCLRSGEVDAVYIALPNSMHCEFTVRAARMGVHVLCEKPMAVTERECERMLHACGDHDVRLMIAYRLHFERANLEAVRVVQTKQIGEPRIFNSVFSMDVKAGNIRLQDELGGGTLYDLGIYCINAARYLFRSEPLEVFAFSAANGKRFREVDEMTSAVMRFPTDRLATFTSSFGAANAGSYEIIGTKGTLRVSPAYEYAEALKQQITLNDKTRNRVFPKRDQFAPELIYFSDCILKRKEPEPSGIEGLADVRIIQALYESAETGRPVGTFLREIQKQRPSLQQEINRPPVEHRPVEVYAEAPHREE